MLEFHECDSTDRFIQQFSKKWNLSLPRRFDPRFGIPLSTCARWRLSGKARQLLPLLALSHNNLVLLEPAFDCGSSFVPIATMSARGSVFDVLFDTVTPLNDTGTVS